MRLGKKELLSFGFVLLVAAFLYATFDQGEKTIAPDRTDGELASVAELHKKFELSIFRNDLRKEGFPDTIPVLERWPVDAKIILYLPHPPYEELKTFASDFATLLSRITNLDIITSDRLFHGWSELYVQFVDRSEWDPWLKGKGVAEVTYSTFSGKLIARGGFGCIAFLVSETTTGLIRKASAGIPADLSLKKTKDCFLEEVGHGLGMQADNNVALPSVFNKNGDEFEEFPLNDLIIFRTLYDPRLKPGMPRQQAVDTAYQIIEELHVAVREHGKEALFQR